MTTNDRPSGLTTRPEGISDLPSQERHWRPSSSYRVRNTRAIIFQQTQADLPRFVFLQEALRPITRAKRLPSKTEVFRAAMEVAVIAERQDPGVLTRVLSDMRLSPSQEAPMPDERESVAGITSVLLGEVDSE